MDAVNIGKFKDTKYISQPQCQFFVSRKKRLCRMTVREGRNYCGEHEPQPRDEKGKGDIRVPCPYDSKHTCYASKLLKHLAICNARQTDTPTYIVTNINAPADVDQIPRRLLSEIPQQKILALIDKVNILYDRYVKNTVTTIADQPIHHAVSADFMEEGRAESSLRHLRQASSLLHLIEADELVRDGTCYVELGAGKGHLSYYVYKAWCEGNTSRVVLVDRASLRHKRDNKLRDVRTSQIQAGGGASSYRIRADLAHLALEKVPEVSQCEAVVGFAKHLCGAATDYALRCITGEGVAQQVRGLVLATCCHHRCEPAAYVATQYMQEIGITPEDLNIMLGVVSWATCGDGRSRQRPAQDHCREEPNTKRLKRNNDSTEENGERERRARAGRHAKALLDYGRVRYLRERGFDARLVRYVSHCVSLENVAIVARKHM